MVQKIGSSDIDDVAYDFSSPLAVMAILKSLRGAEGVSVSERNELRDLIFSYANGNQDEAVRLSIVSRLRALGIAPNLLKEGAVSPNDAVTPPKKVLQAGFAIGRMTPSFTSVNTFATPAVDRTAQKIANAPVPLPNGKQSIPPPPVVPQPNKSSDINKKPVEKVPTVDESVSSSITSRGVVPGSTVSVSSHVATNADVPMSATPSVTVGVSSESVSTNEKSNVTETVTGQSVDTSALLERIRVIKADINARAGNPVNLVAIDKAVGNEYMMALLDAMKQLSSGNTQMITSAMKRLELVYEQALSVIKTVDQKKSSPPVVPAVSPAVQDTAHTLTDSTSAVTTPTAPPAPSKIPVIKNPVVPAPVQSPPTQEVSAPVNPPLGVTRVSRVSNQEGTVAFERSMPVTPPTPSVSKTIIAPVTSASSSVPQSQTQGVITSAQALQNVPIHSSKLSPIPPVAQATPLRRVDELPTLAEVKNRSESGNPLYTQEITDGLEQLLSEWSIFRKSGIFGTGPHGSNHPLFKKIAPLQVPLLISGRFEGATDEVRQSITDYMNGWRYEQGIVYNKDETFEQYLRRVVKHIIDSQKLKI